MPLVLSLSKHCAYFSQLSQKRQCFDRLSTSGFWKLRGEINPPSESGPPVASPSAQNRSSRRGLS